MTEALKNSHVEGLERIHQGKVRDTYAIDDNRLLIVTTDRLSVFDCVLEDTIPEKGAVLNEITKFWMQKTAHIAPNHLDDSTELDAIVPNASDDLKARSVVAKKLKPLAFECIVRGYITGSGWESYQKDGTICGILLPEGLKNSDALPEPIFTPSTKAEKDENVSFAFMEDALGKELAGKVRDLSLELYSFGRDYAKKRGIIIADTKFEFGLDEDGTIHLIDEVLTPDSSRFWPKKLYGTMDMPPSMDKQYVRDHLISQHWNKKPPAPRLSEQVIANTTRKYLDVKHQLLR